MVFHVGLWNAASSYTMGHVGCSGSTWGDDRHPGHGADDLLRVNGGGEGGPGADSERQLYGNSDAPPLEGARVTGAGVCSAGGAYAGRDSSVRHVEGLMGGSCWLILWLIFASALRKSVCDANNFLRLITASIHFVVDANIDRHDL